MSDIGITELESLLITMITANWNLTTGGPLPIVDQGDKWQNQDLSNADYILVYDVDDSHKAFDLYWASRIRKPIPLISIATGTSRARLNQLYSEISRIFESRSSYKIPLFYATLDSKDLSKEIRLWYQKDVYLTPWLVEIP